MASLRNRSNERAPKSREANDSSRLIQPLLSNSKMMAGSSSLNSGTSPHTYQNIALGDVKPAVLISPNSFTDPSKTMLASNSNTVDIQLSSMRKYDDEFKLR